MPIVCPHKLRKINLPTIRILFRQYPFFALKDRGQGNKRQSNKGTEDRGMEDKVTKELRITRMSRIRDKDLRHSRNS